MAESLGKCDLAPDWRVRLIGPRLVLKWSSSQSELACADSETRFVAAVFFSFVHCGLTGYGDGQDRRPITPPPCIRLIVQDALTKKDIDIRSVILQFIFCAFSGTPLVSNIVSMYDVQH